MTKSAVEMIEAERHRQVGEEGRTVAHDLTHTDGELARAAACYAFPHNWRVAGETAPPVGWPWEREAWKPTPNDRIRELVKAGALILAEIDRLQIQADYAERAEFDRRVAERAAELGLDA